MRLIANDVVEVFDNYDREEGLSLLQTCLKNMVSCVYSPDYTDLKEDLSEVLDIISTNIPGLTSDEKKDLYTAIHKGFIQKYKDDEDFIYNLGKISNDFGGFTNDFIVILSMYRPDGYEKFMTENVLAKISNADSLSSQEKSELPQTIDLICQALQEEGSLLSFRSLSRLNDQPQPGTSFQNMARSQSAKALREFTFTSQEQYNSVRIFDFIEAAGKSPSSEAGLALYSEIISLVNRVSRDAEFASQISPVSLTKAARDMTARMLEPDILEKIFQNSLTATPSNSQTGKRFDDMTRLSELFQQYNSLKITDPEKTGFDPHKALAAFRSYREMTFAPSA